MLGYALFFFIIAIIAGIVGFGGIAGTAVGIAQLLFYVFIILLAVSVLIDLSRGRKPVV